MRIVASRSHGHAALAPLAARLGMSETVHMGSSLKTCVVARGDAQLYPRIGPTWEWDTAAGQAILEAAGGALLTVDGAPLTYGARGDYLNPSFVAASTAELARRAAAAIRELAS
jgi:3'(2'), 5'-bisphosphate nucleotidase